MRACMALCTSAGSGCPVLRQVGVGREGWRDPINRWETTIFGPRGRGTRLALVAGRKSPERGRSNMNGMPEPQRVLLVEDDEMLRGLLTKQLRRKGYVVTEAPDA